MLCLGLHGLCRVYSEQFRSTQSLHRANPVNTESTQSNLGSTQSLHRAMRTYTGSTQNNMGSTQSLHRAIQDYTESTQTDSVSTQSLHRAIHLHRIYTEQYGGLHRVYTEQCRPTQSLHRTKWGLHRVYTEQCICSLLDILYLIADFQKKV